MVHAIGSVNTVKTDGSTKKEGIFSQIGKILTSGQQQLQGESDDRINLLLLGIGGPGHDGPYLTDTMMVVSYKPSTNEMSMISIPRDLVVNIPNYGYRKINSVFTIGKDQNYPGGGPALTVKVVSDLLDIPIQYYGLVDFSGFEKIIDRLGGVNVDVENSFTDYAFPTDNYGYQTVRFTKGQQVMNGVTALNFARSRHGNNGEGSDFARAKRQQKIISGVKVKLLSFGTLLNPKKISDIIGDLGSHTQTNMEVWEMLRFAKLAGNIDTSKIINKVLQDGPGGLLHSATGLGGAFILIPNGDSYEDMRFLAQNIFLDGAADREATGVLVVNASKYTTNGSSTASGLEGFGIDVSGTVTWKGLPVNETTIIDASGGQYPQTIALLKLYRRGITVTTPSAWATATGDNTIYQVLEAAAKANKTSAPTIVLILGKDQPQGGSATLKVPTQTKTTTTNTNSTSNKNTNTKTNSNANSNKNTNSKVNSNANLNGNSNSNTPIVHALSAAL